MGSVRAHAYNSYYNNIFIDRDLSEGGGGLCLLILPIIYSKDSAGEQAQL